MSRIPAPTPFPGFGCTFLADGNDPKPPVESKRKHTNFYPYTPGGLDTPIAEILRLYSPLEPFFTK